MGQTPITSHKQQQANHHQVTQGNISHKNALGMLRNTNHIHK